MLNYTKSRGDTIIEVLFAITVFSLVVVSSLSIMNQGSAAAQRTLEVTLARQQIDAQAETLRFLNTSYVAAYQEGVDTYSTDTPAGQWQLMHNSIAETMAAGKTEAADFVTDSKQCSNRPEGAFVLNTRSAKFINPSRTDLIKPASTFSQVVYNGSNAMTSAEGIWIDAIMSDDVGGNYQDNTGYIDFNIRACWDSPGQSMPVTLGTIVRLYEPRG